MIGNLDPRYSEATLVGAGISGLLLAYALARKGFKVKVYDSAEQAGGLIRSYKTPFGLVETAAHSLWVTPVVETLLKDLGIEMLTLRKSSKKRYIMRGGEALQIPLGWLEIGQAMTKALFYRKGMTDDLNLQNWGERQLSKAVVDHFFDPMVQGIYGATPDLLDVRAAFPQWCNEDGKSFFWQQMRNIGQRKKGRIMTPKKGMETLIHSLLNAIDRYPESSFYFNSPIQDLDQVSDGRNLILCTPAPVSAQIIGHRSVELAQMLKSITYLPLLTATVFIRREDLPRNPRGLGILVPSKEKRKVMGMLMNSSSFDERLRSPDEFHSFTLFFGGSRFPEVVNLPDDKIHEIIRSELDYLLSFKTIPAHTEIVRWKQALPLYNHHLRRTWQLAKQTWCKEPGNLLFGNYTGAISIRGMIEACAKV